MKDEIIRIELPLLRSQWILASDWLGLAVARKKDMKPLEHDALVMLYTQIGEALAEESQQ